MKEIPAWLVKAIANGERIAAIHHPDTKVPDALVYSGLEFLVERYMPLGQIVFARIADLSPLQRLQQFAADTGVPVSFEIAEKAMKGGG